ncbi:hypothetical protein CSC70_06315 [Pseudoxanthomonas kalamensis DSM 18571]|nr:hypothetical protein [Pseudoxanthomonas kalamensis]KAF1710304.1 hypothetical protein CSC70_06315 [Pseudoxanthomonas kalamensis DSM 18571]
MPALLRDQPRCPEEFSPLVGVLGQFAAPIDWASLEAWSRMSRRHFARWELDVIAFADRKRMS